MLHSFKKLFCVSAVLLGSVFLSSCNSDEDNEPAKDTVAPKVSFTNLKDGGDVWSTVSVSVTATDNDGVEKVDIYIDGTLTSTLTAGPFDLSWDSKTVTDGTHTIKAVVADKSGNVTEKLISVTVKNVLVTINIAADQLTESQRGFIFLSDENGKLITSVEYKNGDGTIALKNGDFSGANFFLTEAVITTDNSETSSEIYTFSKMERGKSWVLVKSAKPAVYVGTATLNYSNASKYERYTLITNGQVTRGVTANVTSSNMLIKKSPSKVFVTKYESNKDYPTSYHIYSGIVTGSNNIDLSLLNTPMTKSTITLPAGSTGSFIRLYASPTLDSFDEIYPMDAFFKDSDLSYDFYYPDSIFPTYHSFFYYTTEDYYYRHASSKKFYSFDQITNNVAFNYSDGKLTYSASGSFDYFITIFENETAGWYYVLPEGTAQVIPTLEIPSALSEFSLPSFGEPTGYSVYDVKNLSDYESLKSYIRQSTRSIYNIYETGSNYTGMTYPQKSTGGRISKRFSLSPVSLSFKPF
jgi:hypothetical protein